MKAFKLFLLPFSSALILPNERKEVMSMSSKLFTPSFLCILLANFLLYFGFWLIIPILPFYLMEEYNLSESSIGIILALYTASALIIRPFSGYILDTFSRRFFYILSYIFFTVIFLGYACNSLLAVFVFLRILHGLAFGAVTIGGNTIVVDILPSEHRGEGLGYYGLTNNLALSIAPLFGLLCHNTISYSWIFGIAFFASFVGLVLALNVKVPAKPQTTRQPNLPLSLDRFFLLKSIPASISLILLSIPYGAVTNFVAIYITHLQLSFTPGLFFVCMAAGMGSSRIFAGKYIDKGYLTECIHYGLYLIILAFFILGSAPYLLRYAPSLTTGMFFVIPFLLGVGFGILFPAYNTLYINLAQHNQRATAVSSYLTSWDIGLGIGMIVCGTIADHFGFAIVYFIGSILTVLSSIYFSSLVKPHYLRNRIER